MVIDAGFRPQYNACYGKDFHDVEEATMTLTLELPDESMERLAAVYPDEAARNQFLVCSLLEAIEWKEQDYAEIVKIIEADIAEEAAGFKGYTQEEMDQHWAELEAEMRRKLKQ